MLLEGVGYPWYQIISGGRVYLGGGGRNTLWEATAAVGTHPTGMLSCFGL